MAEIRGLLVDWGGVLTTSVFDSFAGFCRREGLAEDAVTSLFRTNERARELLTGLEVGELAVPAFEHGLAELLGVQPQRLVARLTAGAAPNTPMRDAVRTARKHGIATGLMSNSWGPGGYDADVHELFDGVVISGEVGVRKPMTEMYVLGAQAIGVAPASCVFVDDLPGNLGPARALGMTAILHRDTDATIVELGDLLGLNGVVA